MLLLSGSNFALGAEMGNCMSRAKNIAKTAGELACRTQYGGKRICVSALVAPHLINFSLMSVQTMHSSSSIPTSQPAANTKQTDA